MPSAKPPSRCPNPAPPKPRKPEVRKPEERPEPETLKRKLQENLVQKITVSVQMKTSLLRFNHQCDDYSKKQKKKRKKIQIFRIEFLLVNQ